LSKIHIKTSFVEEKKYIVVNFIYKATMSYFFIVFVEIKSLVLYISKTVYHICTPAGLIRVKEIVHHFDFHNNSTVETTHPQ